MGVLGVVPIYIIIGVIGEIGRIGNLGMSITNILKFLNSLSLRYPSSEAPSSSEAIPSFLSKGQKELFSLLFEATAYHNKLS